MKSMRAIYQCKKNIGDAVEALKSGKRASRESWGFSVENDELLRTLGNDNESVSIALQSPDENSKMTHPYIYMTFSKNNMPYQLTTSDILATDWIIIDRKLS